MIGEKASLVELRRAGAATAQATPVCRNPLMISRTVRFPTIPWERRATADVGDTGGHQLKMPPFAVIGAPQP
jgi:hypothetical protein